MKRVSVDPKLLLLQIVLAAFFLSVTASASPQIILDENGWSEPVGTWDSVYKIGKLTTNVTETITIGSDGITLDGNEFSVTTTASLQHGIFLDNRADATIKNLTISGFIYGIKLKSCTGIKIEGNFISNTTNAIDFDFNNTNNTVNGNSISNAFMGLAIYVSSDNAFSRNTIEQCSNYGFQITGGSNNNEFTYNHLSGNDAHILIRNSTGCRFYNNNFLDHVERPHDINFGVHTFFMPPYTYGNYWDFHVLASSDSDGDGILNDAYSDGKVLDEFPFAEPFGWNHAPTANAGSDLSIKLGYAVQLDGSQSEDPEEDPLSYLWAIVQKPPESDAVLIGSTTVDPTFEADVIGEYIISLTVTDFFGKSDSDLSVDEVILNFSNAQPVAIAGENQSAFLGDVVALDGSGSSDADLDPLAYAWSFASMPADSNAEFTDSTAVQTTFAPDLTGTYEISLVVNDGFVDSDPALVIIEVVSPTPDLAVLKLMEAVEAINLLDSSDFNRTWQQNRLTRKVNRTIRLIDYGFYQWAYLKLRFDILRKIDGWNVRGVIDRNDWITTPFGQNMVYPSVKEALDLLENIL